MSHDHHHMDHDWMSSDSKAASMGSHDHTAMMASSGVETHDSMTHMMQMYFDAGYKATILFKQWNTETVGEMIGSCIGIFILAILYEGLKYLREMLHKRHYKAIDYSKVTAPDGNGSQVSQVRTTVSFKSSMTSPWHYLQSVLHLVQMVVSYFLMLIVMTFNVWLFLAVVLGCTVGYFFFGWQKSFLVDITEHCH